MYYHTKKWETSSSQVFLCRGDKLSFHRLYYFLRDDQTFYDRFRRSRTGTPWLMASCPRTSGLGQTARRTGSGTSNALGSIECCPQPQFRKTGAGWLTIKGYWGVLESLVEA